MGRWALRREAAEMCFEKMAEYINHLNTDVGLYEIVAKLEEDEAVMANLNTEQQRMAMLLKQEFEHNGIHLDDAGRHRVRELQVRVLYLLLLTQCRTLSRLHI
jgi:Zn-dependent oligopeptidase